MKQFFERRKLPKFTKGEIESLSNSFCTKEIKSIMNNLPKKKTQVKYLRNVWLILQIFKDDRSQAAGFHFVA